MDDVIFDLLLVVSGAAQDHQDVLLVDLTMTAVCRHRMRHQMWVQVQVSAGKLTQPAQGMVTTTMTGKGWLEQRVCSLNSVKALNV
jgi:hypothetical protein